MRSQKAALMKRLEGHLGPERGQLMAVSEYTGQIVKGLG